MPWPSEHCQKQSPTARGPRSARPKGWGFAASSALVAVVFLMVGCEKTIFGPNEPRSQFDRFDDVRDRRVPQYRYDEFGARRPNLRARLVRSE